MSSATARSELITTQRSTNHDRQYYAYYYRVVFNEEGVKWTLNQAKIMVKNVLKMVYVRLCTLVSFC